MPACLPSPKVGQRGTNMVEIHSPFVWCMTLKVGPCLLALEYMMLPDSQRHCQLSPQTGQR